MGQYIGFNLGKEEYVIPILMVQEIMKPTPPTPLPHAPDYVMGIINLRGQTISVIDLKSKLALRSAESDKDGNVIVINLGKVTFGAKVDAITGVMNIKDEEIDTNVSIVGGSTDECLKGVARINEDKMVLILDFSKLLSIHEMSILGAEEPVLAGEPVQTAEVVQITQPKPAQAARIVQPAQAEPAARPAEPIAEPIVEPIQAEPAARPVEPIQMEESTTVIKEKANAPAEVLFVEEVREALQKSADEKGIDKEIVAQIMNEVQLLLGAFAHGDIDKAEKAIENLSSYGEREIFSEVGKMTRKLHDSLRDFKQIIDPRLKTLTEDDMPEATDKLEWVITKTDEAATKTISIAERNQSKVDMVITTLNDLEAALASSGALSDEHRNIIQFAHGELGEISNDFLEIMLAQEFQDLTGQILKKVIRLVKELEDQLVRLVMVFGVKIESQRVDTQRADSQKVEVRHDEQLKGPQIKPSESVVSDQGDVDALLSEFGF